MKDQIFAVVDKSLAEFWKSQSLSESDFYCRNCGNLLIDLNEAKNVRYKPKPAEYRNRFVCIDSGKWYVESPFSRWSIVGRRLSGKIFFRHLCWDCFFRRLPEVEDIPRRARKGKWYAAVLKGEKPIPKAWTSPSEYFKILFDMTDDELQAERSKFDTASLKSFIRRHGEEQGRLKYKEYQVRQAYTCSKEYMLNEKGMSEDDWKNYNMSRANTRENFIKRYGEDLGEVKWKQYCDHEAYAGTSLDYFIDTYGKEIGRAKYLDVCTKKALVLENFINKYGLELGKEKFSVLKNKSYSDVSQALFIKIDHQLGEFSKDSRYATKNAEEVINLFFEDGTCKTCQPDYKLNTKIIEFNGDFWHANPLYYKSGEFIYTNGKHLVDDIWSADKIRKDALERLGYSVMVVWEHDYYSNPDKVVDECVAFLKS